MDITSYLLGKKSSGGGSGKIDTLAKLNANANEYIEYLFKVPDTYEASTSEETTLYTPESGYDVYFIVKYSNKFRIIWCVTGSGGFLKNSKINNFCLVSNYNGYQPIINWDNNLTSSDRTFNTHYKSSDYGTLALCLSAIKNNATTYTKQNNSATVGCDELYYTNTFVVDNATNEPIELQKISSNETIEVKS